MVKKTRKQKERAVKRREYLVRLAKEEPPKKAVMSEVKEKIPRKEVRPEKVKVAPVEYISLDFRKALLLSGLFIAILIILAILEARYGFLGPLASRLMERLVG